MSTANEEATAVPSPIAVTRGRRAFPVVVLLAALIAIIGFRGLAPRASAAPAPPPRLEATTSTPQQFQAHMANADADVGPGQAEPVLVGSY
jgi:hypothetical protein